MQPGPHQTKKRKQTDAGNRIKYTGWPKKVSHYL